MHNDSLDASTAHADMTSPGHTKETEGAGAPVPALTVLYHPDLRRVGERALLRSLVRGGTAHLSRREPLFVHPGGLDETPLRDRHLSRRPWTLTAEGDGLRLDPGTSSAAIVHRGSRLTAPTLFSTARVQDGVPLELAERIVLLLHYHRPFPAAPPPRFDLVGDSDALVQVRADIERVADLDVPVLVRGESGTGKELVAAAIHTASRRPGPYLAINLATIPGSLASAELFGASKGAFTGANQAQAGYFQRAHGGSLFLDEIGEVPVETQVKLLRVLETGEIQPLGAQLPHAVDVRTIAATDADLEQHIDSGTFRAPLFHRLAGYEIHLPPMRRRRDDFGRLFMHFLKLELTRVGEGDRFDTGDATQWLAPSLVARLADLEWPGNVRQLRNVVRRLAIGSRGRPRLEPTGSVEQLLNLPSREPDPVDPSSSPSTRRKPSDLTEDEVRHTLADHRWDLKATAEALGISRASLYVLVEKFPSTRAPREIDPEEIRRAFDACDGDLEAMVEHLEISSQALRRRLRELKLHG